MFTLSWEQIRPPCLKKYVSFTHRKDVCKRWNCLLIIFFQCLGGIAQADASRSVASCGPIPLAPQPQFNWSLDDCLPRMWFRFAHGCFQGNEGVLVGNHYLEWGADTTTRTRNTGLWISMMMKCLCCRVLQESHHSDLWAVHRPRSAASCFLSLSGGPNSLLFLL